MNTAEYKFRTLRGEDSGLYVRVEDLAKMLGDRATHVPELSAKVELLVVLQILTDLRIDVIKTGIN